jgi:uncharacterized membrane protein
MSNLDPGLRTAPSPAAAPRSPAAPWALLGVGLGGLADGILLHQVLQWHHMVSHDPDHPVTTVAGLQVNTLADGLFHVASWLAVTAAVALLLVGWRRGAPPPAPRRAIGLVVLGWGAFNLVEGLVDHQVLGIHHVRDDLGGPLAWDLGFLAVALLMVVVGWLMARTPRGGRTAATATRHAGDDR